MSTRTGQSDHSNSRHTKGSANAKSMETLRWAAMKENQITATAVRTQGFEEHDPQLYSAFAPMCTESALVKVKSIEVNNGLEAWHELNATYDSNNQDRQRVRMQCLSQLKRSETILQTTETVERWRCDVREYELRFGNNLDEDIKIGVTPLALPQVQNHCHLNSHILMSIAQVRTMLFDFCRAQADTAAGYAEPMDLSVLGKGKTRKGDKKGKGKGKKGKKVTATKMAKARMAKARAKTTPEGLSTSQDTAFSGKTWCHMKKDCWWNESSNSGKDAASSETPITPAANNTTELTQSDDDETAQVDSSK